MTNGDVDSRMTAEEFDLTASVILLEGGHNRKALREIFSHIESMSTWSQDLIDYLRFISISGGNKNNQLIPGSILSNLLKGFRLLRAEYPVEAVASFVSAFNLGLGSKLNYWTSLGLYGIGASCLRIQHFDLARRAFLRCIESGWALNDHSAVAKGFGGLGNLFMTVRLPHLAFDAYSTDLGFIQSNHYFIPILRVRRSLAYAMTHDKTRGLKMLLAETGDFFDDNLEGSRLPMAKEEVYRYRFTAREEVYRGLVACSVVWNDSQTFKILPKPERKGFSQLSVVAYHLAGMYHESGACADHQRRAMSAFEGLEWGEYPVQCWLTSLLSKKTLETKRVPKPRNLIDHEVSLPCLSVPTLSFLDRFREVEMTDPWTGLEQDIPIDDAIMFTLERGMISNTR